MKKTLLAAFLLFGAPFVQSTFARLMYDWSYQELFDKSDFVVIANPVSRTRDTSERTILRDIQENVIGLETQFETQVVLKGTKRARFMLHHYRSVPSRVAVLNGPLFMIFDPKRGTNVYVLFLKREPDGRFAPTGGQTDIHISVREMRSPSGMSSG